MSFESSEFIEGKVRATEEVRAILSEMFTETGVKTLMYYLKTEYDTELADAWENPSKFNANFIVFLGEFGGNLILRRIRDNLARKGLTLGPTGLRATASERNNVTSFYK